MKKIKKQFICQSCKNIFAQWQGCCSVCNTWDTLMEHIPSVPSPQLSSSFAKIQLFKISDQHAPPKRMQTNLKELDRVCGQGLVQGSAVLIGGDPGIGKSTLLLQAAASLSNTLACLYISGEESVEQISLRAQRLNLTQSPLLLAHASRIENILSTVEDLPPGSLVVIDSLQTMQTKTNNSPCGSISQVRLCAQALVEVCKMRNIILFLISHVTKEGSLAGPRVVEHLVDTVLYFEGERNYQYRILRAVKNRFGPTDEIGVFEMTQKGLEEVSNPSAIFLAERRGNISGSCVFAGIEGTRPILVEIQSLITQSASGAPRRSVLGYDGQRLSMLIAILEARCGIALNQKDIYLNITGGLKISEPCADLAVIVAILSGFTGKPVPSDFVVFGEIGLSGELRNVPQMELRCKEAFKLGFKEALAPKSVQRYNSHKIHCHSIGHIQDVLKIFPLSETTEQSCIQ